MTDLRQLNVRNPRTGAADYRFVATTADQLATVAASIRAAQPHWRDAGIEHRVAVLRALQHALQAHQAAIVDALSLDTGRRTLAKSEFFGLLASLDRWCVDAPSLLASKTAPAKAMPDVDIEEMVDPYPLLGAISPWNFPLLLSFIDVIPALLAGCGAMIKPSEVTPRFAQAVSAAIRDVPTLCDVLHLCPGDGQTGAALIEQVDVVAFTGSVATGKKVLRAAAEAFIPAFLELGGKDPAIVLAGSDIERATTSLLRACVAATGQACQSIERIYVHDSLVAAFSARLTEKAAAVPLSSADPHAGIVGPLIFERQADIIAQHLADALAKGAVIRTGGTIEHHGGGLWIAPTVVTHVSHDMQLMTEETFGPIMPIMSFSTEDEAIALANDSQYGLSAAVFGPTIAAAQNVARRINAGGISVNDAGMTTMLFETEKTAFGYSGMGPSRVGDSGLTRFLRRKSLYLNAGTVAPLDLMKEQPE